MTVWAYGLMTIPKRRYSHLPRTLKSLAAAGFDRPHLFVDDWTGEYADLDLPCTFRESTIGVVGNWALGMIELYIREPLADRYAMFQDDVISVRNLRPYLEKWFPENGYQNLYSAPSNETLENSGGWYESRIRDTNGSHRGQSGRGALGLVFSRFALVRLLSSDSFVRKPQDLTLRGKTSLDGAVVEAMNRAGYREFVHNPSLLQHLGYESTLYKERKIKVDGHVRWRKDYKRWTGPESSQTFPGEQFDALSLCK